MQVKAPLAALPEALSGEPLFSFYFQFVQLKRLYRQGWLLRGIPAPQCESVAEHTLGVATLAMILGAHHPNLDQEKLLRMALLHDLGEVHAGDLTPHDGFSAIEKSALEHASFKRVTDGLPVALEWEALFDEYERQETLEAQLVKQLDRLEMALQARVYEAEGADALSDFYASARAWLTDETLVRLLQQLEASRAPQAGGDGRAA